MPSPHGRPAPDLSRRDVLRRAAMLGAVLGGGVLSACRSESDVDRAAAEEDAEADAADAFGPLDQVPEVRVAVVAPFTGPQAHVGAAVRASLSAAVGYLDAEHDGQYRGIRPLIVEADAPLVAEDGLRAYRQLAADPKVVGVLWCGAPGLVQALPAIVDDGPVTLAVTTDLQGLAPLTGVQLAGPTATGLSLFQLALPHTLAFDVLLAYAGADRGYRRAALVHDPARFPLAADHFARAAAAHGVADAGAIALTPAGGRAAAHQAVERAAAIGADALVVWTGPDAAADVAQALHARGAGYVGTPAARGPGFRPQLLGAPGATATATFTSRAGAAATTGTVGVAHLGGVTTLPRYPLRTWMERYQPQYHQGRLQGGEDGPATALALLLAAVDAAGSSHRRAVVPALEGAVRTRFATPVTVSFRSTDHVAVRAHDAVLLSVQRPPVPYQLGREWDEVLPEGYAGPTHLVDPTLAANRRAHPDVVELLLDRRYGTSCRPDYQDGDAAKVAACRAVN